MMYFLLYITISIGRTIVVNECLVSQGAPPF